MNNKNFQCLIRRSVLLYKAFHKTVLLSGFVLIAVVNTNAQSTVQSTLDNLSKDSNSVGQDEEQPFISLIANLKKRNTLFIGC
jgi:hypothetical protein